VVEVGPLEWHRLSSHGLVVRNGLAGTARVRAVRTQGRWPAGWAAAAASRIALEVVSLAGASAGSSTGRDWGALALSAGFAAAGIAMIAVAARAATSHSERRARSS
jgi:hypothetical protein